MSKALSAGSGALSGAAAGMALGPIGAGIGGALGLAAGLFGGSGDDEARAAMENALKVLSETGEPPDLSNPLVLQGFQQAGLLTPENIEKLNLNADQVQELIENPEGKKNQEYALNALKDMSQTGLTATDRAAFNALRRQVGSDTQAKTNQILQQQQMQGKGSGGNALAAQLSAIQGANQNASAEADRLAAAATEARSAALSKFSNLSGEMRNTDLGKQKFNLENELARQRFLDQNSLSRQKANVDAENAAREANLQRQWGTSDRNIAMQNQELYRQNQEKGNLWDRKLKKAGMESAVYTGQSGQLMNQAANQAASNQSMITAGLTAAGQLGKHFGKDTTPLTDMTNTQVPDSNSFTMPAFGIGRAGGGVVGTDEGQVPIDSPDNDKEIAVLSPGEIVIPKSFAHDPDLAKAYINFIHKDKSKK